MYLLDTNIVSDLIRHPDGAIAAGIAEVGEAKVVTSIIVADESRFGAARRGSQRPTANGRDPALALGIAGMATSITACCAPILTDVACPSAATTCSSPHMHLPSAPFS